MNTANSYDGTGKLAEAIAALYGLSPKSQARIAELIKQAKGEMGIASKAKVLPADTKLSIWRWHYDRLHSAQPTVEIISQSSDNKAVEIVSQTAPTDSVEITAQPEMLSPVEIIAQPTDNDAVEIISQTANEPEVNNLGVIRIAFYVSKDGKRARQVIALDGFFINGLVAATGITRQDVPKWVQAAVDSWAAFDSELPITRQVKCLIVSAMTESLINRGNNDD